MPLKEYKVHRLTLDVVYAQIGFCGNEFVINAEFQLEGTLRISCNDCNWLIAIDISVLYKKTTI